jgi:hypothetical protein
MLPVVIFIVQGVALIHVVLERLILIVALAKALHSKFPVVGIIAKDHHAWTGLGDFEEERGDR